ncbi:hypothetical protein MMC29_003025 [Sticta canariensis]|nr:hypothetical protein [Sticta canariensis]
MVPHFYIMITVSEISIFRKNDGTSQTGNDAAKNKCPQHKKSVGHRTRPWDFHEALNLENSPEVSDEDLKETGLVIDAAGFLVAAPSSGGGQDLPFCDSREEDLFRSTRSSTSPMGRP